MPLNDYLQRFVMLAQDGAEAAEGAGNGNEQGANPYGLFLLIGVVFALYIFLMVLPQRRDQKRAQEMMDNLKKNDRVLFGGGILGTIVNVHSDGYVTLKIDESSNAKMRVLRSGIVKVLTDEDSLEEENAAKTKS